MGGTKRGLHEVSKKISILNLTDCTKESVIGLIDIDCFECQWLERENPSIKGLPFAAVSFNENGDLRKFNSVNYEARSFGVSRQQTFEEAMERCPKLQLRSLPTGDPLLLKNAAAGVLSSLEIFAQNNFSETSCVIQFSPTDEFYVDLTSQVNHELEIEAKLEMARCILCRMVEHIFQETGFTCSAGVSTTRLRAKLAVEQDRPRGVSVLHPDDWDAFLDSSEIKTVPGLKGTLGKQLMDKFGIRLMKDLRLISDNDLLKIGLIKGKQLITLGKIFSGDFVT